MKKKAKRKVIHPKTRNTWKKAYLALDKKFDELCEGYAKLEALCKRLRNELMDVRQGHMPKADEWITSRLYGCAPEERVGS